MARAWALESGDVFVCMMYASCLQPFQEPSKISRSGHRNQSHAGSPDRTKDLGEADLGP